MDNKKDINTEQKIIAAAKKVFLQHGMAGARMQSIADEAGINKALLHYYFRSKEKLFSIVFQKAVKESIPQIVKVFNTDAHFFDKIRRFVSEYLEFIGKNPYLPMFIMHELASRPEHLKELLSNIKIDIDFITKDIQNEVDKGTIRPIKPMHLMVNIVSLCVFPVISKPMMAKFFIPDDPEDNIYAQFLEERKTVVADFVINSIKNPKSENLKTKES